MMYDAHPTDRRTVELGIELKTAAGGHLWDNLDRRYIDITSGWNVVNAGWNNPDIGRDCIDCVGALPFSPSWCSDEYSLSLKRTFASLLPGYTAIFGCSGADGIDNALKVARMVTGRPDVISFSGAYHGSSTGAALATGYEVPQLSVLGLDSARTYLPLPTENDFLAIAERNIRAAKNAGAIIMETVLTNAGCRVLPDEYLVLLRRLADELGLLLICDEVGTGFGRTGAMFACENRVKPDIIVCGKALTNGNYPLSACLVLTQFTAYLDWEAFSSTFGGAPLGCAVALSTIKYHEVHDLKSQARQNGQEIINRLLENLTGRKLFNTIHGSGLELAVHLNWTHGGSVGLTPALLIRELKERGVFATLSPFECHLMIMPPLNSDRLDLVTAMDAIGDAFAAYD